MQIRRARPSKVAFATLLFLVVSTNSVPSVESVPASFAEPTDLATLGELDDLSRWLAGDAAGGRGFRAVQPGDIDAALRAERGRFELFREQDRLAAERRTLLRALPFGDALSLAADRHRVDSLLLAAMVQAESSFRPRVVSPAGAIGLMQIMPALAATHGTGDPFDPATNLDTGARYFSHLLQRFEGDVTLALAAYNAGPTAVRRFGGIPPYSETTRYVRRVLAIYGRHQRGVETAVGATARAERRDAPAAAPAAKAAPTLAR